MIRRSLSLYFLASLAFSLGTLLGQADPASTIQTLMIVDQGNFMTMQWSFYFVDFPNHFTLEEDHAKTIVLDNPATLYDNVSELISVGLDVRINGKSVHPDHVSRLTISPNKICTVTMIYRGQPGGHFELRAPVLKYLPATGMINYEILPEGHQEMLVTGNLIGHPGPFPEVITYQELNSKDQSVPIIDSDNAILFRSALKTAWINSNWLFMTLIVFLSLSPRKAIASLLIIGVSWIGVTALSTMMNACFPWTIPEFFLALPVTCLGVLAARQSQTGFWFIGVGISATILNTLYDLQQFRLTSEDDTLSTLAVISFGFICGFSSVSLVLYLLVSECKKFPKFGTEWAPKICWVIAILAIFLPLQKMLFKY